MLNKQKGQISALAMWLLGGIATVVVGFSGWVGVVAIDNKTDIKVVEERENNHYLELKDGQTLILDAIKELK